MASGAPARRSFFRSDKSFVVALTVAVLAPFINEPYRMDEPLFLWAARNIEQHPLNFYGFNVHWFIAPAPMWMHTKNPPLASYYIALAARIVGWREFELHAAFMIIAIAAALGTYALAERMAKHAALAAAIAVLTPIFLLCSTTVMCDTMLLALWLWATVLWMRGLDAASPALLALSALLIALAFVTKYFGLALVPLLFVYGFIKRRSLGLWALWFVIPLAAMHFYERFTQKLYGTGLLEDAASFPSSVHSYTFGFATKLFVGLVFLGGCLLPMLLFGFGLATRKTILMWLVRALVLALLFVGLVKQVANLPLVTESGIRWGIAAQLGVFCIAGIALLGLPLLDLWHARDAESWLLLLWTFGGFVFAAFMNWGATGRTFLPLAPPLAILIVRRMEARLANPDAILHFRNWKVFVPLTLAAAFSLAIASADYRWAASAKHAAGLVDRHFRAPGHALWFEGHWGWQWYMEVVGAQPVNFLQPAIQPGDVIAVPANNTETYALANSPAPAYQIDVPSEPGLTLQAHGTAGFYGFSNQEGGPAPFLLTPPPPERYYIIVWR